MSEQLSVEARQVLEAVAAIADIVQDDGNEHPDREGC